MTRATEATQQQLLKYVIQFDSNAKLMVQELNQINNEAAKTATALNNVTTQATSMNTALQSSLQSSVASLQKISTQMGTLTSSMNKGFNTVNQSLKSMGTTTAQTAARTTSSIHGITSAVTPLGIATNTARTAMNGFLGTLSRMPILGAVVTATFAIGMYEALRKVVDVILQTVSAFGTMGALFQRIDAQFTVLFGTVEKAVEIIDYARVQALKTPFDFAGLLEGIRVMKAFGLETKFFFGRIADTAAGTGKSFDQVTRALGLIASGATGRGIYYLRLLGFNMEEMGIKTDSAGRAIGSTQEIMTKLVKFIDTKYKGMSEVMARTFPGAVQNMKDVFEQFAGAVGKPVLDELGFQLNRLVDAATNHLPQILAVGNAIGNGIANAISWIDPLISGLLYVGRVAVSVANSIGAAFQSIGNYIGSMINSIVPGATGMIASVVQRIFPGAKSTDIKAKEGQELTPIAEELLAEEAAGAGGGGGGGSKKKGPTETERITEAIYEEAKSAVDEAQDALSAMRRAHEAETDSMKSAIEAAQSARQDEIDAAKDLQDSLEEAADLEKEKLEELKLLQEKEIDIRLAQIGINQEQLEVESARAEENTARAQIKLDKIGDTSKRYGNNILVFAELNANAMMRLAKEQEDQVRLKEAAAKRVEAQVKAEFTSVLEAQEEKIRLAEAEVDRQKKVVEALQKADQRMKRAEEARMREYENQYRVIERAAEARLDALRNEAQAAQKAAQAAKEAAQAGAGAGGAGSIRGGKFVPWAEEEETAASGGGKIDVMADLTQKVTNFVDALSKIPTAWRIVKPILDGIRAGFDGFKKSLEPLQPILDEFIENGRGIAVVLGILLFPVIAPIVLLFAKLYLAITFVSGALPGLGEIIVGIAQVFLGLTGIIEGVLSTLEAFFLKITGKFDESDARLREGQAKWQRGWDNLGSGLRATQDGMADSVYGGFANIFTTTAEIVAGDNGEIAKLRDAMSREIAKTPQDMEKALSKHSLGTIFKDAFNLVENPINKIARDIATEAGKIPASVSNAIGGDGGVQSIFKMEFVDVASKLTEEGGPFASIRSGINTELEGLTGDVDTQTRAATSAMSEAWLQEEDELVGHSIIPDMMSKIIKTFADLTGDLASPITNLRITVYNGFVTIYNDSLTTFNSLYDVLVGPGGIITRLFNDIKRMTDISAEIYKDTKANAKAMTDGWNDGYAEFSTTIQRFIDKINEIPKDYIIKLKTETTSSAEEPKVEEFATGGYISETQIAKVHKGEIVVPATTVLALTEFLASGWPQIASGLSTISKQLEGAMLLSGAYLQPASYNARDLHVNIEINGAPQPQAVRDNLLPAMTDWWEEIRK